MEQEFTVIIKKLPPTHSPAQRGDGRQETRTKNGGDQENGGRNNVLTQRKKKRETVKNFGLIKVP